MIVVLLFVAAEATAVNKAKRLLRVRQLHTVFFIVFEQAAVGLGGSVAATVREGEDCELFGTTVDENGNKCVVSGSFLCRPFLLVRLASFVHNEKF